MFCQWIKFKQISQKLLLKFLYIDTDGVFCSLNKKKWEISDFALTDTLLRKILRFGKLFGYAPCPNFFRWWRHFTCKLEVRDLGNITNWKDGEECLKFSTSAVINEKSFLLFYFSGRFIELRYRQFGVSLHVMSSGWKEFNLISFSSV